MKPAVVTAGDEKHVVPGRGAFPQSIGFLERERGKNRSVFQLNRLGYAWRYPADVDDGFALFGVKAIHLNVIGSRRAADDNLVANQPGSAHPGSHPARLVVDGDIPFPAAHLVEADACFRRRALQAQGPGQSQAGQNACRYFRVSPAGFRFSDSSHASRLRSREV